MIVNNLKPLKISAFYLDRQKSFVPKKRFMLVKELLLTKEEFYCDGCGLLRILNFGIRVQDDPSWVKL